MNNFRIALIIRILLLSASIGLSAFLFFTSAGILLFILSLSVVVTGVVLLIKYVDRTNAELANFLQSINYSDFTLHYDYSKRGKSFKQVSDQFNKILEKFKETRNEKEESLNYLTTVVQHIGVGLISFDSKGEVELMLKVLPEVLMGYY